MSSVVHKKCLILSQGPVPTPEHTKVEGGGLRCWGLAKGLRANGEQLEITVAYHDGYRKESFTDSYEGIAITTWTIDTLSELIGTYDSVVVSYCMGPLSVKTADVIRPDQQLILDCYVPIYVEVSARGTNDLEAEYRAFTVDAGRWAHVLARGDIFLCANQAQRKFYKGVLSAVGRVNPATYGKDFIRIVPYGIYRQAPMPTEKPITKLIKSRTDKAKVHKILWFGGIYPWFDLRSLVDAIKKLSATLPAQLVIVGAKNPFNSHPDFVRPYEELVEYIEADPALKDLIILQDWVDFEKRADWYLDSDLVVVVNKLGEENELAWRTRLVDFMWADLPIITNGGDPLGEELLAHQAAARLHGLSADEIVSDLRDLLADKKKLKSVQTNLSKLKKQYYWDVVTAQLALDIATHTRAADLEEFGTQEVSADPLVGTRSKLKKIVSKARMLPAYYKKYGGHNTYLAVRTTLLNQFKKVGVGDRVEPGVVMIAHQLDNSGAPYVFIDLTKAVAEAIETKNITFHAFNPSTKDSIVALNKLGIKPHIHLSKDIEISLVKGDTVVLNTVAHSAILKNGIYNALESGTARKLVWFIHEDDPELLFPKSEVRRLKKLLDDDKAVFFIAAKKTLEHYQALFKNVKNIRLQPYKYPIPEKFQKVRSAADFDNKLSFILPGTVGDGRKGQLPIFYALAAFAKQYYKPHPERYRDFELVYVGVIDDFLSRQLVNHGAALFGKKFKHHGIVSHERSYELMMQSNVTVCYSLRECLPLFVFEGMATGHPLLRNDCSGIDEQLFEGKNGFYLGSKDFTQVVDTFETILNKGKVSNQELADMSAYSHQVAMRQADHSYTPMVDEIVVAKAKD